MKPLALVTGTAIAAVTLAVLPAAASASAKLTCTAKMSNSKPAQYATIYANVHTSASAKVTTTAHYKSTNTAHSATADSKGNASLKYPISRAAKGYRVVVTVAVKKGSAAGSCSTSFTPH